MGSPHIFGYCVAIKVHGCANVSVAHELLLHADFLYREYHANSGRWIQPDPAGLGAANPANPQTWNRYAYVANNPLNAVDPLGLTIGAAFDVFGSALRVGLGYSWNTLLVISQDVATGNWIPFGVSPEGAIEIGNLSGYQETGEYPEMTTVYSYVFVLGGSAGAGPKNPANNMVSAGKPQPPPCRIVDPVLGALEFTVKVGPEVQLGPVKADGSFYKNVTTGGTGAKLEASAGLVSIQADSPTPEGGSLNGGGPGNNQYSASFLGFQFNFTTGTVSFNPAKSFSLGAQFLLGGEVSFNSDTYMQLGRANAACRAQGGR